MNKAQIQFNWIFIIIAGALILAFFFGFALRYQKLQEEKLAISILNNLDNSLTSFQASSFKTFDTINLPKNIEISCRNIIIDKKEYETNNLIFSQKNLKDKLLIWFQPYKLPFKITNFYYIIDGSKKFHLSSNNQQLLNEVIGKMPLQFQNNVIINSQQTANKIEFLPGSNINEGMLRVQGTDYPYLGSPQLYAILFAEDYGECLKNKINQEIQNVINIYEEKASFLQAKARNCNYNAISNQLALLKNNPNYDTVEKIETLNQDLAAQNCPVLF